MRVLRLVIAAVLLLVGLVWIGQGTGVIAGSAMSGSSFWAIVGLILVIVAAATVWLEYRRAARRSGTSESGADSTGIGGPTAGAGGH